MKALNPLNDKQFLLNLDTSHNKIIYARVVALNNEELPLETIEGRVTQGSINVDGNSTVRRSCSLTLIANNLDITDYYWGLKTKFKLEIGLANNIDDKYENIIWFPQGIYVIATFNTTHNTNSHTISISGKDKMCLLNGELGGSLPVSANFAQKNYTDYIYQLYTGERRKDNFQKNHFYKHVKGEHELYKGDTWPTDEKENLYEKVANTIRTDLTLSQIITEVLVAYGGEPLHNIIINDLDMRGLELLEYRGDTDSILYMLYDEQNRQYTNMFFDATQPVYPLTAIEKDPDTGEIIEEVYSNISIRVADMNDNDFFANVSTINDKPLKVRFKKNSADNTYTQGYYISKFQSGNTAGYRLTDLVYTGELINSYGESLTSVLDKIVNMLGNYEYFYDLDGRFVFQQKPNYINTSWNPLKDTGDDIYVENSDLLSKTGYNFQSSELVTVYQNNPVLTNIKNDYSIWGARKTLGNKEVAIHMRYAIDKKPEYYKALDGTVYVAQERYDELYTKFQQQVVNNVLRYQPKYKLLDGLEAPEQKLDGSWTPGWWDLRDWYEYYTLLTGKEPTELILHYATNPTNSPDQPLGYTHVNLQQIFSNYGYTDTEEKSWTDEDPIWLFSVREDDRGNIIETDVDKKNSSYKKANKIFVTISGIIDFTDKDGKVIMEDQPLVYDLIEEEKINVEPYYMPGSDYPIYHLTSEQIHQIYNNSKYGTPIKNMGMSDVYYGKLKQLTQVYAQPFRACTNIYYSDFKNSTYQCFPRAFFYNPAFPNAQSYESIVEEAIDRELSANYTVVDWRELIYQMAKDHLAHGRDENFYQRIIQNNINSDTNIPYYPDGKTGYERYYTDMLRFWRELYNPFKVDADYTLSVYENYYHDANDRVRQNWNVLVDTRPELLNFWLDFLDCNGELAQYSIQAIGDRPKVVNDKDVTSIYFRDTPSVIFYSSLSEYNTRDRQDGYEYFCLPQSYLNLFSISAQGKSAKAVLDELLYKHSYSTDSITITSVPIYYLQPNTLINVKDELAHINGEYLITRMTIPLTYNGTMQITATKMANRIH